MRISVEQFLEQVAQRGSWMGGGSVAALSAALSAALLEKLVVDPRAVRRLRRMWRECLALINRDATTFARVIQATRTKNRATFRRSLKLAIDVPRRVFEHACTVQMACRAAERAVKPSLHSDLRCARALAHAASESARALIETNLRWLGDPAYAARIRRQLTAARHADAR
ncbi:MAG: cyclodeaminase/cyclohydrolase family protein [Candidatus Omnitrophica bacterium]|nr:cyclodeaminase/cyclohydrolase family protein [Candidatus Omnitrophota bacterium]